MGSLSSLSSFGSFGIREKGERIGRNPKTGEEVPITPRRGIGFPPEQYHEGPDQLPASLHAQGSRVAGAGRRLGLLHACCLTSAARRCGSAVTEELMHW